MITRYLKNLCLLLNYVEIVYGNYFNALFPYPYQTAWMGEKISWLDFFELLSLHFARHLTVIAFRLRAPTLFRLHV
jgi:hypothetical protein